MLNEIKKNSSIDQAQKDVKPVKIEEQKKEKKVDAFQIKQVANIS